MGLFTASIKSFDDLLLHQLRDVYYAENRIIKSLPGMIAKSTDPELKRAFEDHLEQTRGHVARLEEVFRLRGVEAQAVVCPGIDGILREANEIISEVEDKNVLDSALIAAAQAVEHYEISRYGTIVAWAQEMGYDEGANILRQTMEEERVADSILTKLARSKVNYIAAA